MCIFFLKLLIHWCTQDHTLYKLYQLKRCIYLCVLQTWKDITGFLPKRTKDLKTSGGRIVAAGPGSKVVGWNTDL